MVGGGVEHVVVAYIPLLLFVCAQNKVCVCECVCVCADLTAVIYLPSCTVLGFPVTKLMTKTSKPPKLPPFDIRAFCAEHKQGATSGCVPTLGCVAYASYVLRTSARQEQTAAFSERTLSAQPCWRETTVVRFARGRRRTREPDNAAQIE